MRCSGPLKPTGLPTLAGLSIASAGAGLAGPIAARPAKSKAPITIFLKKLMTFSCNKSVRGIGCRQTNRGSCRVCDVGHDRVSLLRTRISKAAYLLEASELGDFVAMTTANSSDRFYGSIPVFRGFGKLMDPALYSPLPDDWTIGVADIVESTKAIAQARYKAVNMAGAAVIAAVTNPL